jgi:hypothetical protein
MVLDAPFYQRNHVARLEWSDLEKSGLGFENELFVFERRLAI